MKIFSPTFAGKTKIDSEGQSFLKRFRTRVETGLLMGKPHPRAKYRVTVTETNLLAFSASGVLTAINIGLNDVVLRYAEGAIEYRVTYWRWAMYSVALCGILGLTLAILYFAIGIEGLMSAPPNAVNFGSDRQMNIAIFWGMVVFWGFVWPWLLVAFHKPFAEKALIRIIRAVDNIHNS